LCTCTPALAACCKRCRSWGGCGWNGISKGDELPQGLAALSRLEWLYWDSISGTAALPQGPWQRSLQLLITSYETAAASLPFLSGAERLERLSLTTPPGKAGWQHGGTRAHQWPAFWGWAERHRPLRCLQLFPEPEYAEAPGTVQPEVVNAVASLAAKRPNLHVDCRPGTDPPRSVYRKQLLSEWHSDCNLLRD